MSLNELTKLAEEMEAQPKLGAVFVKVRRGAGKPSAPLVVMTFNVFKRITKYSTVQYRMEEAE